MLSVELLKLSNRLSPFSVTFPKLCKEVKSSQLSGACSEIEVAVLAGLS